MGPRSCFCEDDLYTARFGDWESTEIEKSFFGKIDFDGIDAVEYFSTFNHPGADSKTFKTLLLYMSLQKLRTPKGLLSLADLVGVGSKNKILYAMQEFQRVSCALWAECIWSIVDASESETKFIISDHPVTVYNSRCFPASRWCRGYKDPDISLCGTYTLFPLDLNKMLILANKSWVRNPYMNPLKLRPNSYPFRDTVFNFTDIQTGRMLTEHEVNEINFIVKKRAFRYIAAGKKEWLYPENHIKSIYWDRLGDGHLLMPDPRQVAFTSETVFGFNDKHAEAFDVYGRRPWQPDYNDKQHHDKEFTTSRAFMGEFARKYGSRYRGRSYRFGQSENINASPEYHASLLKDEQIYKARMRKKNNNTSFTIDQLSE